MPSLGHLLWRRCMPGVALPRFRQRESRPPEMLPTDNEKTEAASLDRTDSSRNSWRRRPPSKIIPHILSGVGQYLIYEATFGLKDGCIGRRGNVVLDTQHNHLDFRAKFGRHVDVKLVVLVGAGYLSQYGLSHDGTPLAEVGATSCVMRFIWTPPVCQGRLGCVGTDR